jgi:hypothetical protein
MSDPDLLDWTISDAPAHDEAPDRPPAPAPRPRLTAHLRRVSRRAWLLLGAVVVLVVGLTAALPFVETLRQRQAVQQVVALQEQARLAGNWDTLRSSFADDQGRWAGEQIAMQQGGGFIFPLNLPGVRPLPESGRVGTFQIIGPQLARADVVRSYQLSDGSRVSFALPQFYQFSAGSWKQVAPPKVADPLQALHGTRVDMTYFAADADFAASLMRDLDALLATACADWDCPTDLRVPVGFRPAIPTMFGSRFDNLGRSDSLGHSLTYQTIFSRRPEHDFREVNLLTGLVGGYPAGAAATEAVRRAISLQALLSVARRLTPETAVRGNNLYEDALIAREAARLGLDDPRLPQTQIATRLFEPDELWRVESQDSFINGAWFQALVIVNQLLLDRPQTDERNLMHAFDTALSPTSWLADGLGLNRDEAAARLAAAAAFEAPVPTIQPPAFVPDLALSCSYSVVLATLAGDSATLLAGQGADTQFAAWSPDGRRLALTINGRLAVVDLDTGAGLWPPQPMFRTAGEVSWASDTVLVYPPAERDFNGRYNPYPTDRKLALFDAASGQYLPPLENFDSYRRSPDSTMAVVSNPNSYPDTPSLAIIAALGSRAIFVAPASDNPAWSPDSQQLAYILGAYDSPNLMIYDLSRGEKRSILPSYDPGVPPMPVDINLWPTLTAAWSPAGDQLVVSAYTFENNIPVGWVGLMRPDGHNFHLLPIALDEGAPLMAAFSADGQFLAVDLMSYEGIHRVAIYSVADESLVRSLPRYGFGSWSPAGHALLLSQPGGLNPTVLRDPANPAATPETLGPTGCTAAAWRP